APPCCAASMRTTPDEAGSKSESAIRLEARYVAFMTCSPFTWVSGEPGRGLQRLVTARAASSRCRAGGSHSGDRRGTDPATFDAQPCHAVGALGGALADPFVRRVLVAEADVDGADFVGA